MDLDYKPVKLSKKNYLALPSGEYLVSSCYKSPKEPVFADRIAYWDEDKKRQWAQIVAAHADQRHFFVFKSKEEYETDPSSPYNL